MCVVCKLIISITCVLRILNTLCIKYTLYNNTRLLGERLWLKRASFQRTESHVILQIFYSDISVRLRLRLFLLITFHSMLSLFDLPFPFPPFFYGSVFSNAPTYQRIGAIESSVYCKFRKTCTIWIINNKSIIEASWSKIKMNWSWKLFSCTEYELYIYI